jgi:hypothetical protein
VSKMMSLSVMVVPGQGCGGRAQQGEEAAERQTARCCALAGR